jgi:hypothetical protein
MSSRSLKDMKCGHTGYTIETGHGGLKKNKDDKIINTGDKSGVTVKGAESSGMARANAQKGKPKAASNKPEAAKPMDDRQAEPGWDQIGKSGADIVKTYKSKKSSGGTSGVPA